MSTVLRAELSAKNRYALPKHRYLELKHFCLQYPDWEREYEDLDGSPRVIFTEKVNEGSVGDPTGTTVERRLWYRERMELVEKAALEAADDLAPLMLKAVTQELSYTYISPPCCKEVWYSMYRRFFWLLDKTRK